MSVDWTQHKTDSVSSKTMSKKYPNLRTEGQKNGENGTEQKGHVGQRKKKSNIFFIGVPEEERENWIK